MTASEPLLRDRHDDDVCWSYRRARGCCGELERFCVVDVNLITGAVDEDFRAIRGEPKEKRLRPSNSFLLMSLRVFMSKAQNSQRRFPGVPLIATV